MFAAPARRRRRRRAVAVAGRGARLSIARLCVWPLAILVIWFAAPALAQSPQEPPQEPMDRRVAREGNAVRFPPPQTPELRLTPGLNLANAPMPGVVAAAVQMPGMDMPGMQMPGTPTVPRWQFMSDAVIFGVFNRQGGPRGDTEFRAPNWWMGMWARPVGRGSFQIGTMLSLDPATATSRGYSELFQAGETLDGRPIVDRQHPHDLVMQLAAVWHRPLANGLTLTLAGAPIGEPALGPVAFMHRASAAENPAAPLGHHTMDSTHIAMGVITAGLARGIWTAEGSLFNAREPDENRWDVMDPGPIDSWSARVWLRPRANWELQVSHGLLRNPEALEPGDLRRTTASIGWLRQAAGNFTAAAVVVGHNNSDHGAATGALAELTRRAGRTSAYTRLEVQQVEAALLLDRVIGDTESGHHDSVVALTLGAVRDLAGVKKVDVGVGFDVTAYRVPALLQPAYGARPVSFHIFLRLRPTG
ncbi:MAG: hypothetical protein ABI652_05130, partial [Acidobacteriota bacterium]